MKEQRASDKEAAIVKKLEDEKASKLEGERLAKIEAENALEEARKEE